MREREEESQKRSEGGEGGRKRKAFLCENMPRWKGEREREEGHRERGEEQREGEVKRWEGQTQNARHKLQVQPLKPASIITWLIPCSSKPGHLKAGTCAQNTFQHFPFTLPFHLSLSLYLTIFFLKLQEMALLDVTQTPAHVSHSQQLWENPDDVTRGVRRYINPGKATDGRRQRSV